MAKLLEEMARVKSKVDAIILKRILPRSNRIGEIELLYRMMRDYPERPGKGLRPFFCTTSCKAYGGSEDDAILTAACIELFQNWILIHDDIEDASELRRGQPVLHRKYDPALAINAGDALHARMWGCLLDNEGTLGPAKTLGILKEFSTMVNRTTEGQHMELAWVAHRKWELEESDYFGMVARKTAWYTVASPCRLGVMIAGGREKTLEKLLRFGSKLGTAFQIQDDLLNLTGDQAKYGKESSDDILEGKRTLILLRLLKSAGPTERRRLLEIMNKRRERKTIPEVREVLRLMRTHGAIEYAQRKASALAEEALGILESVRWSGEPDSIDLLQQAARFSVERQW